VIRALRFHLTALRQIRYEARGEVRDGASIDLRLYGVSGCYDDVRAIKGARHV
jgi:hypothetical protein